MTSRDCPFMKGDKALFSEPDNPAIWVLNDPVPPLIKRDKFPFRTMDFRGVVTFGK